MTGIICNVDRTTTTSLAVRDFDVSDIGTLSYEEKAQDVLEQFDTYAYTEKDGSIEFNGSLTKSVSEFGGFEYLNTLDESELTRNYSTKVNCETGMISLVITTTQNGEIIEQIEEETTPVYDEETDDYVIILDDGSKISVSESLLTDNLNPCVALLGVAAAAVVAIVIIVLVPVIETIVNAIVSAVTSFWSWLKGLFGKKSVFTTVETKEITYSVSINNTTYKLEEYNRVLKKYNDSRYFDNQLYYLAVADTDDGCLYISTTNVSELVAQTVLTSEILIETAHKDKHKNGNLPKFVLSVYTQNQQRAYNLAYAAGKKLGDPGALHHTAREPGYFNHYHPGAAYFDPHCFYGYPKA